MPCQLPDDVISTLEWEGVTRLFVPYLDPKDAEGFFNKLTDGVGFASGEDEVFRSVLLEHHPHALNVVTSCPKINAVFSDALGLGTYRVPSRAWRRGYRGRGSAACRGQYLPQP